MTHSARINRHLPTLLVLALLAGCSASSQYMKPTTRTALAEAPPQGAVVVFLRPSGMASAITFEMFDGSKRFLGDALPGTYWEMVLEPGQHWFYAMAENAGVMQAELGAGRRYYVVVRPYMGAWSARVELTPLTPQSADWPKLGEWLRSSQPQRVDLRGGQASLDARRGDVEETIRDGAEIWRTTDEAWRNQHRLRVEDSESPPRAAPVPAARTPVLLPPVDEAAPVPPAPAPSPTPTAPAPAPTP